jgi:hypothetical protein
MIRPERASLANGSENVAQREETRQRATTISIFLFLNSFPPESNSTSRHWSSKLLDRFLDSMTTPPESLLPVLSALASALSPNEIERAASLAQLQSWATVPGYYSSLVEIFANRALQLGPASREIKLQAVVQFKNGVDKYWRRSATKYAGKLGHTVITV